MTQVGKWSGRPGRKERLCPGEHWFGKGRVRTAVPEPKQRTASAKVVSEPACGKSENEPFLLVGADGSCKNKMAQ